MDTLKILRIQNVSTTVPTKSTYPDSLNPSRTVLTCRKGVVPRPVSNPSRLSPDI